MGIDILGNKTQKARLMSLLAVLIYTLTLVSAIVLSNVISLFWWKDTYSRLSDCLFWPLHTEYPCSTARCFNIRLRGIIGRFNFAKPVDYRERFNVR